MWEEWCDYYHTWSDKVFSFMLSGLTCRDRHYRALSNGHGTHKVIRLVRGIEATIVSGATPTGKKTAKKMKTTRTGRKLRLSPSAGQGVVG